MNWGWGGIYNGFFAFNGFSPGDQEFDYKSEVVIGIKP